jgi:hypothetical protein
MVDADLADSPVAYDASHGPAAGAAGPSARSVG